MAAGSRTQVAALVAGDASGAERLVEITSAVGGVHAQIQASAELQLGARVADVTHADIRAALWDALPSQRVNSFQCPSDMTSTVPSTTLMAVSSSIAYAGPGMSAAHRSASAMVFSGSSS